MYRINLTAVLFVAISCFLFTSVSIARTDELTGITVTGIGEVEDQPNIAFLTFGITTQASSASSSARDNAQKTNAVIAALKNAGIPKSDIETTNYSVRPVMDYKKTPPVTMGYSVSNEIRVTTRDLKGLGTLIDTGINAGANNVQGIRFSIENDTALRQRALAKAVDDAKAKAGAMAAAAGVKLGKLISMSEAGGYVPRPMLAGATTRAEVSPTPIIPGELTVTANVTMVYAIL